MRETRLGEAKKAECQSGFALGGGQSARELEIDEFALEYILEYTDVNIGERGTAGWLVTGSVAMAGSIIA